MTAFLDFLSHSVLLADGAMGTATQDMDLSVEKDFLGSENCTDVLSKSRPDLILDIHCGYFEAGADAVETNTFGASPLTLAEFDLAEEAFELNRTSARIARQAADKFAGDTYANRPRFVLGSIGPGTKLPSLEQTNYRRLCDALTIQCAGLAEGGVDAFLIETCQDLIQIKAAVQAARQASLQMKVSIPIIVQVTVETTGTLLVGSDIATAGTVIEALNVDMIGMNCATGPREMDEHIEWLSRHWRGMISVLPNAGLPEVVAGKAAYPLSPEEMSRWLERFIDRYQLNMIGGCCGTGFDHIRALDAMLREKAKNDPQAHSDYRPKPKARSYENHPGVTSLYRKVPYQQENAFFDIGERCNANGSRRFRQHQENAEWDACVAMGKEQVSQGAHALDLCTAFVGRDEKREMLILLKKMHTQVDAPLIIDSTQEDVLEAALEHYGGKAIINSMNFEDGEEPAAIRVGLARRFGAALIALTIDEKGMAKDVKSKVAIAQRLHDFACVKGGLPSHDLLIDPLTFTICTGNEDDRRLALQTLEGIRAIREALPECPIILGLSNVSFGLDPGPRRLLNSVFLHEALECGMTGAILHSKQIEPLHRLNQEEITVALDMIYDRRRKGYDPLHALLERYAGKRERVTKEVIESRSIEEILQHHVIDGQRENLEKSLDQAREKHPPLDIINDILLVGMKTVGDLFGAGKMQLPFVLQSAEVMKAAVRHLEPFMEQSKRLAKGTMVLATVKGDVHDIGKNLVDIILSNNGYRVINLGIKQPIANILSAVDESGADVVGMSGLLVKSTVIMRQNLEEMKRRNMNVPVILGGAALNRAYVVEECLPAYGDSGVAYAKDAFEGLHLMKSATEGTFDQDVAKQKDRVSKNQRKKSSPADKSITDKSAKDKPTTGDGAEAPQPSSESLGTEDSESSGAKDSESPGTEDGAKDSESSGAKKDLAVAARPSVWTGSTMSKSSVTPLAQPPQPPFWGSKIIESIPLRTLVPYLNETMLYQFHWGYRKQGRSKADFLIWSRENLRPILYDLVQRCEKENIITARAAYGYWPCASQGDDVRIYDPDDWQRELFRFTFPRQKRAGGLSIADFFLPVGSKNEKDSRPARDTIAFQVVTAGTRVAEVAHDWFQADRYRDYLYLHGLGVETTEAMAEYVHRRIREELGFVDLDAPEMEKILKQGYRGSRYSYGYPACPHMEDQKHWLSLTDAHTIDVKMSDAEQLHPEQSTAAIVVHHPKARYFSV